MSPSIEAELRAALDEVSESIQPRTDLADRVRRANRRRRHALTGVIAAGLAVVVAVGLIAVYGAGQETRRPPTGHHGKHSSGMQIAVNFGVPDLMAVSERMIYVAGGDYPIAFLAAYDRTTGRLVRRIHVPALPSVLKVGPGGLVWLGFYPDSNGGGIGVWLLSPDLTLRSGVNLGTRRYATVTPFDVLPTGTDTAMIPAGQGLATLRLPPPGRPGRPILHSRSPVPGARQIQGVPEQLAVFGGRIVVRVGSDDGRGLMTFAKPGSPVLRPSPADGFNGMAVDAHGLWTIEWTDNGNVVKGLLRLNDRFKATTPGSIRRDRLFADEGAGQVVALGNTVWIVLSGSPPLACFADRGGQAGPVIKLHLRHGASDGVAVVGTTLYVLSQFGVDSYRVPAACR